MYNRNRGTAFGADESGSAPPSKIVIKPRFTKSLF